MRGKNQWNYKPYTRLSQTVEYPFICQVQPNRTGFQVMVLDPYSEGPYELRYKRYQSLETTAAVSFHGPSCSVSGLEEEQDYSIQVVCPSDGRTGNERIVRTGFVPGTVVNYLHPQDEQYAFSGHSLCSPSIVVLPSGRYLVSMDVFAGGAPQNLSLLFYSDDQGKSWTYLNDLFPCFWGKLFIHKGILYMLATTTEYGDLIIGCSVDEGETWTQPVHLLPGSGSSQEAGPHKAPMPVVLHEGRLFTGIDYGAWKMGGHASAILSIDSDGDLLDASNWACTPFLPYDPDWPGTAQGRCGGFLEGNVLPAPDGGIVNMLRYNMIGASPAYGRAAILRMKAPWEKPEKALALESIVPFNGGGNSKFLALQDPISKKYIALASEIVNPKFPNARTVLSLFVSDDLKSWRVIHRLIDYRDADSRFVGFQYPDMVIHGEDLLCVSRTSFNRAKNFHDANYICFHRIIHFRELFDTPSPADALPGT